MSNENSAPGFTAATLQNMATELAGIEVVDVEAAGYAYMLNILVNGIRSMEVPEELEPSLMVLHR